MLVTGGAGFIGSHFVSETLKSIDDVEITVLDSLTYAGSLTNLKDEIDDITFIQGDIRDFETVQSAVAGVDIVVHFAAESHNDNSLVNPNIFFETNSFGTINIANACLAEDTRLHHVSTDEVFGDLPLESKDRFTATSPYRPSSPYSASKASADHIIRSWVRSFGLRATISNCSNNYGARQHWEKLIPATISRLYSGDKAKIYGDGSNVRDWIHVSDHVAGLWLAIEKGSIGSTYLFGANDLVSNKDLVVALAATMGKDESSVEYVEDRRGHDRKYAINPEDTSRELGWSPVYPSVIDHLPDLTAEYLKLLA